MPEPTGKAVFLSYASQDAEAVLRIAETLRASGIEAWFDQDELVGIEAWFDQDELVGIEAWFDQDELVGGDAWDQKIRRQIKDCALFAPVISAATQARTEGYFRLEWRLADQRTHLMAKGRPFLVPIVIDDTKDRVALGPKSILGVQ